MVSDIVRLFSEIELKNALINGILMKVQGRDTNVSSGYWNVMLICAQLQMHLENAVFAHW